MTIIITIALSRIDPHHPQRREQMFCRKLIKTSFSLSRESRHAWWDSPDPANSYHIWEFDDNDTGCCTWGRVEYFCMLLSHWLWWLSLWWSGIIVQRVETPPIRILYKCRHSCHCEPVMFVIARTCHDSTQCFDSFSPICEIKIVNQNSTSPCLVFSFGKLADLINHW